jgi:propanol-preferring alcohol dehydrogenase
MTNPYPDTMQAAYVERFGDPYVFREVSKPSSPESHDLLVKVLAASYCHTDAIFASGGLSQDLPRVGCHEFCGEIVALGPNVQPELGLTTGMRVGIPGRAYRPCTTCFECTHPGGDRMGYSPYCPKAGNLGLTQDGGFQEYCLVDSRQVAPIPDTLTAVQAAPLMCAGLTVWVALHHERLRNARRVAILGAGGGLGHIGVQFGLHLGLEVLAIDISDSALELLHEIQARTSADMSRLHIIDARKLDPDAIRSLGQDLTSASSSGELGVDAVIFLPESQRAFDMGMKLLRNHGTMVVVSFPQKKLEVSAHDIVFRDISVVGSLVGRNYQLREMLGYAAKHKVFPQMRTFPFKELNKLVEEYHKGYGGKLVVDMNL